MDIRHLVPVEKNPNIATFNAGDTVRVSLRVVEGTRERIQVFEGVVIAQHRGGPGDRTFTVRRIAVHNIGVERTFLLYSPRIEKLEVVRHGKVRRAKLYYLRNLRGKAARIKEKATPRPVKAHRGAAAAAPAAQPSVEASSDE